MERPIAYQSGLILEAPDRAAIRSHMQAIIDTQPSGFVVRRSKLKVVANAARDLGFEGDTRDSVPFQHDNLVDEGVRRLQAGLPLGDTWRNYGVTQLHADGNADQEMLSIAHLKEGSVELRVFERGPEITAVQPIALFAELEEDTSRVLTHGTVDTDRLTDHAVLLDAEKHDIIVFTPNHPHMAITKSVPRHTEAAFFER